jgi:hypothetical protein
VGRRGVYSRGVKGTGKGRSAADAAAAAVVGAAGSGNAEDVEDALALGAEVVAVVAAAVKHCAAKARALASMAKRAL